MVQWLWASIAGGMGSSHGWGTKIQYALHGVAKNKNIYQIPLNTMDSLPAELPGKLD